MVKDNGLMVLRKRRYRDLKKVGIGGFLAKTRAPKTALNGKKEGTVEDDQKKRPTWRPKKNKILVQYPEYIQDSFFGKDFMANCPDRVDEEELLIDADKRRIVAQDDGTAVQLNRDALAALEEMKAREEAARKEKEQELADARAAAEAAAKQAAVKARLAQEQLDELKKAMAAAGSLANGTDSKDGSGGGLVLKEDEKAAMDEDDLMLPSDLFGDELFKCLPSGGDLDIDDSALDEAETEGGAADSANGGEEVPGGNVAHSELEEGLRDMLGPDFNTKDMEDILSGFVENDKREAAAVRIKSEAEIKTEPGGGEGFDGNTTGGANTAGDIGSFSTPSASSESTVATDFIKQELISSSPSTSSTTPVAPGGEFVAGRPWTTQPIRPDWRSVGCQCSDRWRTRTAAARSTTCPYASVWRWSTARGSGTPSSTNATAAPPACHNAATAGVDEQYGGSGAFQSGHDGSKAGAHDVGSGLN